VRPTVAALVRLLLAACTGGGGQPAAPARPAEPSLRLEVVSIPLSCQEVPGMPEGCQVGGSGVAAGLGKVRVYASVRLGLPRPGGCREATASGSLSGAAWSEPFAAGGEWCGQRAQLTYRLGGPSGPQGRLEYRHDPPAAATATFTGALPSPPVAKVARDPGRRVDSSGCGRPPPARPGRSVDLEIKADPATSAGSTRRTYPLHVPAGYRPGRAVPAVLLLHGNGGSAADLDDVSGLSELGDRRGFLAVYPQGLAVGAGRPFWAAAGRVEAGVDDLRFVADLLDDLQRRLCVDPARIAAAGFSAGGGVAAEMACDLAGRVASVAVVSGALYREPGGAGRRGRSRCWTSTAPTTWSCPTTAGPRRSSGPCPCRPCPPGWASGWSATAAPATRTCSSTRPRRPGSVGAAAATAPRSSTTA